MLPLFSVPSELFAPRNLFAYGWAASDEITPCMYGSKRELMRSTLLHESDGLRTFVMVLALAEEPMSTSKRYQHMPIEEQVELLSMIGDITVHRDKPNVHAHVVLGKADAAAHGGHLIRASVRPTLEIVITEAPRHPHRMFDAESGLASIDPRPIVAPSS